VRPRGEPRLRLGEADEHVGGAPREQPRGEPREAVRFLKHRRHAARDGVPERGAGGVPARADHGARTPRGEQRA
jgi:glycine/D-amino acid oxidase-like deaminating enzyme